jgi:hypothetical protein
MSELSVHGYSIVCSLVHMLQLMPSWSHGHPNEDLTINKALPSN